MVAFALVRLDDIPHEWRKPPTCAIMNATGVRLGQNTVIGWSPDRDAILAWGNAFYGNPEGGGAGGGAVSGRAPRAVAAVTAAAVGPFPL